MHERKRGLWYELGVKAVPPFSELKSVRRVTNWRDIGGASSMMWGLEEGNSIL